MCARMAPACARERLCDCLLLPALGCFLHGLATQFQLLCIDLVCGVLHDAPWMRAAGHGVGLARGIQFD